MTSSINVGGRPRKEINWDELARLCKILCTIDEICSILDIDENTLNARIKEKGYEGFSAYYKTHSANGKMSLRRVQWKKALEDENTTMQIWLGKQYLGQSDNVEQPVVVHELMTAEQEVARDEEVREFLEWKKSKAIGKSVN